MTYSLKRGSSPLVLSVPHAGTEVPLSIRERFTDAGRSLTDTDWHVGELYDFVDALGGSRIEAHVSRYVVDLNRDPEGASLYPGQATTQLVPLTTFEGAPLYPPGEEPDEAELSDRRTQWFDPYHAALSTLITDTRERYGFALLWDAHSIVSESPRLFDGTLPELNLGTNRGRSAAPRVINAARDAMVDSSYTQVTDGRFKGGWITRHYGRPDQGVHALQMELAQRTHLDEAAPGALDPTRVAALRPVLNQIISAALLAASETKEALR